MTYMTLRQRRTQQARRERMATLLHVGKVLLSSLALVLISLTFTVGILEWLAGCGEVFYYGDGTWKTGQCIFMDTLHPVREGVWK